MTCSLEKVLMPVILLRRNERRYMVTIFRRKATVVEVSCTDSAGYQFWRQLWEPYGRQRLGPVVREVIAFAEAHIPERAE